MKNIVSKVDIHFTPFVNIYVSEGYKMDYSSSSILLSKGRTKGNINGNITKKPTEEWLNIFLK